MKVRGQNTFFYETSIFHLWVQRSPRVRGVLDFRPSEVTHKKRVGQSSNSTVTTASGTDFTLIYMCAEYWFVWWTDILFLPYHDFISVPSPENSTDDRNDTFKLRADLRSG